MFEKAIQKEIHKVSSRMLTPEEVEQVTVTIMRKIAEEKLLENFIHGILMTARTSVLEITSEEDLEVKV